MKATNTNQIVSFEELINTLTTLDPFEITSEWDEFGKEKILGKCFGQLSHEERIEKVMKVLDECRKIENSLISYIIKDMGSRTTKTIKEYQEKREQIIAEGVKGKKQTFSASEVIKISGRSRNTIYNHLKNGTLRGIQNDSGNWTITREALQEYLHRDDF